jgi:hypothetical protein
VLENSPQRENNPEKEEPPPILGSWRRVYAAVLFFLVAVIAALGLFTAAFNQ